MKSTVRHIFEASFGVLLTACIVCSFVAGSDARSSLRCSGISVVIAACDSDSFDSKAGLYMYPDREYGAYIGQPLDSLDLTRMEKIIDGRSAVMKSEAYITRDGILHIAVTQRKPVVRFQLPDGGFYADAEGFIFPLQKNYASHVQVVDGDIPLAANSGYKGKIEDPKQQEWLHRVLAVVNYLENSKMWKDKFVQISVSKNGELIMIPRTGQERFLIGQPVGIKEKFQKMEKYYTHIIPEKGKDCYRYVDLRFKDQIVCRKDQKQK